MTTSSTSLVDRDGVRPAVDAALERHLDDLARELARTGDDAGPLVDALTSMLAGGKRLRAAFCYWSWQAHGSTGADRDAVIGIGTALELFQAAALFHDDVMDDSDLRRGRPSAHRRFEARHRDAGWLGSSRRFGDAAAILLGDLALVASEREAARAVAGLPSAQAEQVRAVFDEMRTEVTVGQYLDVLAQARPWDPDPVQDEERARSVIRSKSARYSVEHPLTLGARLAGADDEAVDRLRAVGLPLGEAFQLRDDVLGVFGDPSVTGKPAGDDLREGKRTVLVVRALRLADDADRAVVLDRLGDRGLTDVDVDALRAVLVRTGAVAEIEELIADLAGPALDALAAADLHEPGRSTLVELGRAAVERRA